MLCQEIIKTLEARYPGSCAMDWDYVGLLVGRRKKEVHRIYVAVDATDEVIEAAIDAQADMLVTHHPMIFSGMKRITEDDFIGRRVLRLIQNDIAYYAMHTNYDVMGMAEAIGKGITDAGKEANVVFVSNASVDDVKNAKAFAMGCPAMGAEVLEESEMEPFVQDIESLVNGKTIALFGSYGWGDGQWMRDWEDRMTAAGATVLNGEGLICNEAPDADAIAECEELGKQLAALV